MSNGTSAASVTIKVFDANNNDILTDAYAIGSTQLLGQDPFPAGNYTIVVPGKGFIEIEIFTSLLDLSMAVNFNGTNDVWTTAEGGAELHVYVDQVESTWYTLEPDIGGSLESLDPDVFKDHMTQTLSAITEQDIQDTAIAYGIALSPTDIEALQRRFAALASPTPEQITLLQQYNDENIATPNLLDISPSTKGAGVGVAIGTIVGASIGFALGGSLGLGMGLMVGAKLGEAIGWSIGDVFTSEERNRRLVDHLESPYKERGLVNIVPHGGPYQNNRVYEDLSYRDFSVIGDLDLAGILLPRDEDSLSLRVWYPKSQTIGNFPTAPDQYFPLNAYVEEGEDPNIYVGMFVIAKINGQYQMRVHPDFWGSFNAGYRVNHSWLTTGSRLLALMGYPEEQEVYAAGRVFVYDNKIRGVDTKTGHYFVKNSNAFDAQVLNTTKAMLTALGYDTGDNIAYMAAGGGSLQDNLLINYVQTPRFSSLSEEMRARELNFEDTEDDDLTLLEEERELTHQAFPARFPLSEGDVVVFKAKSGQYVRTRPRDPYSTLEACSNRIHRATRFTVMHTKEEAGTVYALLQTDDGKVLTPEYSHGISAVDSSNLNAADGRYWYTFEFVPGRTGWVTIRSQSLFQGGKWWARHPENNALRRSSEDIEENSDAHFQVKTVTPVTALNPAREAQEDTETKTETTA